ncbi:hypothetical protein [Advenella mimigardefordensis]|uniref:hypothetical protein n=1 Tax=Advenella mimigardefordensis TaxID=302406 RepID=UPI00130EF33B|nr:hypothetical protein [Advenella mimigardefordensis]
MTDIFRKDPVYAAALLNDILNDGVQTELMIVLRQMKQAFCDVPEVAELANKT